MKSRFYSQLLFLIAIPFLPLNSFAQPVSITMSGCVQKNLKIQFPSDPRLSQVLQMAKTTSCNYSLGVAWLDSSLQGEQDQQKQLLLKNIARLHSESGAELQNYLQRLTIMLQAQLASGRILTELNPLLIDVKPLANRKVMRDAKFHFPQQPNELFFSGFEFSKMAYSPNWDLTEYIAANPEKTFAEKGWVIVIQPDGTIEKHKVGLWSNEKFYAAPGAWILAPIKQDLLPDDLSNFNMQLAEWLATQALR